MPQTTEQNNTPPLNGFRWGSIQTRLLVSFLALVLIPAIIATTISSFNGYNHALDQITNQLQSVATLKATHTKFWLEALHDELFFLTYQIDSPANLITLTTESPDSAAFEQAYLTQLERFNDDLTLQHSFEEISLLDRRGRVVLSTNQEVVGEFRGIHDYFRKGLTESGVHVSTLIYSSVTERFNTVVAVEPVRNEAGETVGLMAGYASLITLNNIMLERSGLGETGETYLIGFNNVLLTDSRFPGYRAGQTYIQNAEFEQAMQDQTNGAGIYQNYRDVSVIGVYHWIPELNAILVAEQEEGEAFEAINANLTINLYVAVGTVFLAILVSWIITRTIAAPLEKLANTARQIAHGNYHLTTNIRRNDEVGDLAIAFDSMTTQLQEMIDTLEQRVAERTERLASVALVSERLVSILDVEVLISEIVNQLKETFDYYHVHIYLLEPHGQKLIMKAGSGEAGATMKEAGHFIPLNQENSLVAQAARTQEVVTVDDVHAADNWLPNRLLPDTQAEMAVPIVAPEGVVGVLDVQADELAGLDEGDANLLRSLASHITVALSNARLFEQTVQAKETAEQALEKIEAQQQLIRELSIPIIPVMKGIIVMPLIGNVDSLRAKDMMQTVLGGITEYRAKVVIIDITGVPLVDTGVAAHLDKTIQAARLKGCHAIITGISIEVAETVVELGINWSEIETLRNLQTGLIAALQRVGFHVEQNAETVS